MTPFDTNGAELVTDYHPDPDHSWVLIALFIGCTVAAWRWL